MSFFEEIRKFIGGLAGDENTKAGVSIYRASDDDMKNGTVYVPFTYKKDGYDRKGYLIAPTYAAKDINNRLANMDNSETISIAGAELDDGTNLTYDGVKDLFNSLDSKEISIDIGKHPRSDYGGSNTKNFIKNYRNYMNLYNLNRELTKGENNPEYTLYTEKFATPLNLGFNPRDNYPSKGGYYIDEVNKRIVPNGYYVDRYGHIVKDE